MLLRKNVINAIEPYNVYIGLDRSWLKIGQPNLFIQCAKMIDLILTHPGQTLWNPIRLDQTRIYQSCWFSVNLAHNNEMSWTWYDGTARKWKWTYLPWFYPISVKVLFTKRVNSISTHKYKSWTDVSLLIFPISAEIPFTNRGSTA